MIDLSIVIPAYNVEKHLAACLDSLLKTQGIEDTQIIIVDDGSTGKKTEARLHPEISALRKLPGSMFFSAILMMRLILNCLRRLLTLPRPVLRI